jgi:uncharacterized small protein (DUF1192 family)
MLQVNNLVKSLIA